LTKSSTEEVEEQFLDEGDDELPDEVARILAEHAEEPATLSVRWVASGVVFRYAAMPDWRGTLADALEEHRTSPRMRHFEPQQPLDSGDLAR
jgi:hypothetical protein